MAINAYTCLGKGRRFTFDLFYPEDNNITLFCLEIDTGRYVSMTGGWAISLEFKILEFGFYTAWLIREQKQ